jgi:large subunit ribosomal protein L24
MKKLNIKKNDTVLVLTGSSKGKRGKVVKVLPKLSRIIVEGVNVVSKHTKPNAANPDGGIIQKELPIHYSNVALIDPKAGNPSKVGKKMNEKSKKFDRYNKKTGEFIS